MALPALRVINLTISPKDQIPDMTRPRPRNIRAVALAAAGSVDRALGALIRTKRAHTTRIPRPARVVRSGLVAVLPVVVGAPVDAGAAAVELGAEEVVRAVMGVRTLVEGVVLCGGGGGDVRAAVAG